MDGLYACGPVFEICQRHGWGFMIVLKDKDLPSVNEEFETLFSLTPENRYIFITARTKMSDKSSDGLKTFSIVIQTKGIIAWVSLNALRQNPSPRQTW